MPELLYIEKESKIEALRRELARIGRGEVAVVLPDGCAELESLPRLRLLQRQAQVGGQELALVTRDQSIRKNARRLGIPVFAGEASLRGRRWRMDAAPYVDSNRPGTALPEPPHWRNGDGSVKGREVARRNLSRSRQRRIRAERRYLRATPIWLRLVGYLFLFSFLAIFLGGFAYYVLPAATITLVPGQRALETTVQLSADPQIEQVDLARGFLPARLVVTFDEASGIAATTGRGQSEVETAEGKVVFTNQTNGTVRIPPGTIVSTSTGDRVDFQIREELEISGPTGTQSEVEIEATEPGFFGNVRSNTITTVSGALRSQVRVTNPEPTQGGASAQVRLVTQADKDRLLDQVYSDIRERAYQMLLAELDADEWIPEGLIQTYIVAQFFDRFIDEPSDELNLTLRVQIQGSAISRSNSEEAAMIALRNAVPERGQLVAESIVFTVEPLTIVTGSTLRYAVRANGNYVIPIDARAVSSAVSGMSVDEASRRLQEEWLLAKEPAFYQDPGWFSTLPQFASRIQVRVELTEAARSGP